MSYLPDTRGLVFFIVVGAVFAGIGGYMWLEQGERISSFESTEATIISSSVGADDPVDPEKSTKYYPSITYEYTVDGETYQNTNVLPGDGRTAKSNRGWAEKIVNNHPAGSTATVYYDPPDPSTSFLLKRRNNKLLVFAGVGGLLAIVGVVGLAKRVFSAES